MTALHAPVTVPPARAGTNGDPPPLTLAGLTKRWGQRLILDDVDLVLSPGETLWLGGRNGAGKTTLLRIAAGLIRADAGSVRVSDDDPERNRASFQRAVGFLSAGDRGLYPRLDGRSHLALWTRLAFVPRHLRRDAIRHAVEAFELEHLLDRRVDRLSLGQRQRLRLAMAFLHAPQVALLDEPQTSLDSEGKALLQRAATDLVRRGGAVLWCSPLGDEPGCSPDRRLELRTGRLVPA